MFLGFLGFLWGAVFMASVALIVFLAMLHKGMVSAPKKEKTT